MIYEFYPNRTICDVLAEMRKANETRNYSYLTGLIEEAQSMANRMEAGLADIKSLEALTKEKSKLKAEVRALTKERDELKPEQEEDDAP